MQQHLNAESKINESVTTNDVVGVLRTEVASRKASINNKRKSVIQLEREIEEEKRRLKELIWLLERLNPIDGTVQHNELREA